MGQMLLNIGILHDTEGAHQIAHNRILLIFVVDFVDNGQIR